MEPGQGLIQARDKRTSKDLAFRSMEAPKRTETSPNPMRSLVPANLDWKSYNEMISHEVFGTVLYVSHQVINAKTMDLEKKKPHFRIASSNYGLVPKTKTSKR